MKNLLFFASLCMAILYTGCSSDKNNDRAEDCSDVICDMAFLSIPITIKYEDDTPVVLDSYEVIEVATSFHSQSEVIQEKCGMFLTGGKFFTHMPSLQILIEKNSLEKRLSCSLLVK